MKRVVTGNDGQGRSVLTAVDEPQPRVLEKAGGLRLTEIWTTGSTPVQRIEPDPGCSIFRVIEYPPDAERLKRIQPEAHFASMGARAASAERRRHPGMHRTDTLDYAIVLSGEIYAVLDEGEVLLKAGDALVQRGTSHAWSNRSDKPATVAFVLIA